MRQPKKQHTSVPLGSDPGKQIIWICTIPVLLYRERANKLPHPQPLFLNYLDCQCLSVLRPNVQTGISCLSPVGRAVRGPGKDTALLEGQGRISSVCVHPAKAGDGEFLLTFAQHHAPPPFRGRRQL